ncbi:MAG: helix-turn-helix transcriptional regulator, partial [Eubacterium sp.]|nr:helix-turn-helix transcriptional regulator [Eubacterium sp.]
DASKRMNFSEAYFCRFFKKAMNMSFTEYVNDYRLQMAADDILRGEKQITDVASDHGFDNESYFFRLFKKKYGITPLKYRQN